MISLQDRFRGALVGLACGDAVGAGVEFLARGTFPKVTEMLGGGVGRLKAGEWTDDTAMALCLAHSLVEKGFNPEDQMKKFADWLYNGYVAKGGQGFVGKATYEAIYKYRTHKTVFAGSTDTNKAGNGSLMRMAPIPMYHYPDMQRAIINSSESSKITHANIACLESCMLFAEMLHKAFAGKSKEEILFENVTPITHAEIISIKRGGYRDATEDDIRGTGYVVQSLEASLWCFLNTNNFKDAILTAVNLGDDADTTGAITGQIAGAFYGYDSIPQNWKDKLAQRDIMVHLADELAVGKQ